MNKAKLTQPVTYEKKNIQNTQESEKLKKTLEAFNNAQSPSR